MAFTIPSTSNNAADIAPTTGLTITKPSGLADGDILYAVINKLHSSGGDWSSSGWANLSAQATTAGSDINSSILRKVISSTSGEPASYTFTNTDGASRPISGCIITVRDGDTSTPEDATSTAANGTNDDNPDSPSITTNTDGALVIVFHGANNAGQNALTFAAPSGYTLAVSENSGDVRAQCAISYAVKASAGATGALTWLNTTDAGTAEWHTYTVAVKPAAGGGGVTIPIFVHQYRQRRN